MFFCACISPPPMCVYETERECVCLLDLPGKGRRRRGRRRSCPQLLFPSTLSGAGEKTFLMGLWANSMISLLMKTQKLPHPCLGIAKNQWLLSHVPPPFSQWLHLPGGPGNPTLELLYHSGCQLSLLPSPWQSFHGKSLAKLQKSCSSKLIR